jgi:UDP-N-acetylmuramyl pentapeptide phosphotransferase/UDP-N-acetylglucosamine-1-phosphate transferase
MMRRVRILDMPSERSSHTRPVPKSGGVAIVAAFALAALVIYFVAEIARIDDRHFWGFLVTALLLATVSFVDDINQKSFFAKVATQTLCVNAVAVAQGQGAFALVELEPPQRLLAFIPFLLFNGVYAHWVLGRARAMRLV